MSAIAHSHRWQEQRNQVERFVGRFETSYRLLLYHAALPLVLTPELLNYLRTQFLPHEQVPWIAEVDLLLSDLCRPVGHELYAMDTDVRAYLLAEIHADPFWQQRMREVAQVLISYVNYLSHLHPGQRQAELQAQRWAAMVYMGDESCRVAVREMAERLQQSNQVAAQDAKRESHMRAELARLTRIAHELEPQLRHSESLVEYARLVQRVLRSPESVSVAELQRSFEVEGIELNIAEPFWPDILRSEVQAPAALEAIAGFPPLATLEFESAAILVLPSWKQEMLDHLRDWVNAFNQLKKTPSVSRRITAYQKQFQTLMASLQDPQVCEFLESGLLVRSRIVAQHAASLQPEDFQRTGQLLSAFLRRHADTILPEEASGLNLAMPIDARNGAHLRDQLHTFANAIVEQLEVTKNLPRQIKTQARHSIERGFLQTVGGLALVVVSDSLSPQDATKALILGYFLMFHGMQESLHLELSPTVAPLTAISTWDESILTQLQPFPFEVARLHRHNGAWEVERSRHQVHQFLEDLGQGVSLAMAAIPAGEFLMGSPEEEPELAGHEGPQHWVAVPAFLMGKYPVSQAQWRKVAQLPAVKRVLRPNPSPFQGDDYPVREVTWYEAVEFCDRLAQVTGRPYRLPTEAEWEYACRAGTTTAFHFGDTISPQLANYNGNHAYNDGPMGEYRRDTTPNGYFGVANAFGLYDMHGNVLEWCLDHWHGNYDGAPEDGSPWFNTQERRRIVRGGCWFSPPQACLSYFRSTLMDADESNLDVGFRVVCAP